MATDGSVALPPPAASSSPPPYHSVADSYIVALPDPDPDQHPLPLYSPPVLPFQHVSGLLLPLFLLPLAILLLVTIAPDTTMSSLTGFFKGFVVPALIALTLYLLLHFALVPLYRRHRARYAQYLPVHTQNPLSTLSSSTTGLRSRLLSSALLVFLLPSRWAEWRYAHRRNERVHNAGDEDDEDRDDDEEMGEDLEFDVDGGLGADGERERRRRDGLSLSIDARGGPREASSDRRLSRELEEGFADSSDDEEEGDTAGGRRHVSRR